MRDEAETAVVYGGYYAVAAGDAISELESAAVGVDWGGNSYTTVDDLPELVELLRLGPGSQLADLGAGSGWPGVYIAHLSGCDVVLSDLAPAGMAAARGRARDRNVDGVRVAVGSATELPFASGTFDAVSHSDLLC